MTTIKTHLYQHILNELNRTIVEETKAALMLLPDKRISDNRLALCRIVVSSKDNYQPRDISVHEVWVDGEDGLLHIMGHEKLAQDSDANFDADVEKEETEWTEEDDLLNITDFQYLINQIAEELDDGKEHDVRFHSRLHVTRCAVGGKIAWRLYPSENLRHTTVTAVEIYEGKSVEPDVTYHTRCKIGNRTIKSYLLTDDDIQRFSY